MSASGLGEERESGKSVSFGYGSGSLTEGPYGAGRKVLAMDPMSTTLIKTTLSDGEFLVVF